MNASEFGKRIVEILESEEKFLDEGMADMSASEVNEQRYQHLSRKLDVVLLGIMDVLTHLEEKK